MAKSTWFRAVPIGLLLIGLGLIAALANPIGFVGGGNDDWQYLNAARCWIAHGPCLPHDHWTTRWPLIAPMAATLGALGVTRMSVEFVPLIYALAVVLVLGMITARIAGSRAAVLAGALLVTMPVFQSRMLKPNVDIPELLFLLCALWVWLRASSDNGGRGAAVATGVFLALAVQTRETALVYLPFFGLAFLLARAERKRVLVWATPGFLLPIGLEAALQGVFADDLLLRWRLALGHGRIPSSALAADVDVSRSPLFNPEFIGGWSPASGLDLHWSVNGIINMLASPQIGLLLITAAILLFVAARQSNAPSPATGPAGMIFIGATAASLLLIYVLAINPQPRSFLPLAASAAMVAAIAAQSLQHAGQRVLSFLLLAPPLAIGSTIILATPATRAADAAAGSWIATASEQITLNETTWRNLALVPEVQRLPIDDPSAPLRLIIRYGDCGPLAIRALPLNARPLDVIGRLRRFLTGENTPGEWLCLLRRESEVLRAGVRRAAPRQTTNPAIPT